MLKHGATPHSGMCVLPAKRIWLAAVFIIQHVHAQSLSPTNDTQSASPAGTEQIQITPSYTTPNSPAIRVNLTALTVNSWSNISASNVDISAIPVLINVNSPTALSSTSSNNFAVIQCDPATGILQPIDTLKNAISRSARAIILYSTVSNYCRLETGGSVPADYLIYSTTNPTDWEIITRAQNQQGNFAPTGTSNTWLIGKKGTLDNVTMSNNSQNSPSYAPGGPSPSTAVAMIILYSITGVITALFLVIIITGAVRAHRHPERYGPRNVLGRPRQSRARGLARAMLETLPIVKFGEKEDDPKAGDVEMANASTTHTREVGDDSSTAAGGLGAADAIAGIDETAKTDGAEKAETGEIATAEAVTKSTSPEPTASVEEDNALGCSICTEDFEKGQDVRVLPCKHSFHPACIDPWLLNVSGTCPLCRIDLRPAADRPISPESASAHSAQDDLPPPLDSDEPATSHRASRRLSGFWEVLNPRRMQHATPEERIEALRQVRERGGSASEELETRRRRRLTARLGEHFGVRTRHRDISPGSNTGPPLVSATEAQSGAESAPVPAASTTATAAGTEESAPTTHVEPST